VAAKAPVAANAAAVVWAVANAITGNNHQLQREPCGSRSIVGHQTNV